MLEQILSKIWPCVLRCEVEQCYYAVCQKSSDARLGYKIIFKMCLCILLHSSHNYRSFEKTTYDVISWVVYVLGPVIMCFYGTSINASMNLQRSGGTGGMRTWMLFYKLKARNCGMAWMHLFFVCSGGKEKEGDLQYYPFRMTPYLMKVQDSELSEEHFCCLILAERVHSGYEGNRTQCCLALVVTFQALFGGLTKI